MTTQPSRLDQIESILFQVAQQQATNTQAIANLGVKIDNLTNDVVNLTNDVVNLTNEVVNLTNDVCNLTDITMHSIQNAENDREAWQSEIKRIWEYLRDRNGGSYAA
jgi:hypothetical protein